MEAKEEVEEKEKCKYFEVSARANTGIEEMFKQGAELLLGKISNGTIDKDLFQIQGVVKGRSVPSFLLNPAKTESKKKKCCS